MKQSKKMFLAVFPVCAAVLNEHNLFYLSFGTSVSASNSTDDAMQPMMLISARASNMSNGTMEPMTNQDRMSNGTMEPMTNQDWMSNCTMEPMSPLPIDASDQKGMSNDAPTAPQIHEWEKLPNFVCMQNARFFTTKEVIKNTVSDGGGDRTYRIDIDPPSGPVIWRSTLLIAWFTCEGNLHHLMTETLHPIVTALESMTINDSDDLPLIGIGASSGLRPWKANESGCHGATFYPLFNALNIDPVLFSFDNLDNPGFVPLENVYPAPNERWELKNLYCFRNTQQVPPGARTASLAPQLLSWSGCDPNTSPGLRVAIVQRQKSRKILNLDALVLVAKSTAGVANVSVLVLEDMTVQEQVREMACGKVIVAGVHGAGLQWTTLWEHTGNRAALIEWGWRDWNSYYAERVSGPARSTFRKIADENIHDKCPVPRTSACCCPGVDNTSCPNDGGSCPWPTKNVDVVVDLTSWSQDLTEMVAFVGQ
jgi:hypothetical protein